MLFDEFIEDCENCKIIYSDDENVNEQEKEGEENGSNT